MGRDRKGREGKGEEKGGGMKDRKNGYGGGKGKEKRWREIRENEGREEDKELYGKKV